MMENKKVAVKNMVPHDDVQPSVVGSMDETWSSGWWIDIGINVGVFFFACGVIVGLYFYFMNFGFFITM